MTDDYFISSRIFGGLRKFVIFYHSATNNVDPRTSKWFLISNIWSLPLILFCYVILVLFGQKFMTSRRKLEIRGALIVYNMLLVALSLSMLCEFVQALLNIPSFNYFCQGVENEDREDLVRLARVNWLFFLSKIVEFLDTVFLILRKKSVSFLHAYHHTSACFLWWVVVKWQPGGTSYFGAMLNCLVHVVMYFYYLISALGPQYRKYLWWKKYLTTIQLLQFSMVFIYLVNAMFVKGCSYPRWLLWVFIGYDITLFLLFMNFCVKEYLLKSMKGKRQ
ncbi:elongation of very long chain fatty acids protein 4-like [Xenia sp. Carnegie-2017]|uniref:elongation of very long chain fatty acids protein 4-like n=1 Tax=Xenia sp. Carnegie-2017 TaxID=2897299 RepID=UPI001F03CAD4|nr:elongation of very long chain fatty acids protein 4-like [Xenia sp. Carnegie-2017]